MTDQGDALNLILGRDGKTFDPRATIEAAYAKPTYRHFGNKDEDPMPMCKIIDQDSVAVDSEDSALNAGSPTAPISCALDDGSVLYVTLWQK